MKTRLYSQRNPPSPDEPGNQMSDVLATTIRGSARILEVVAGIAIAKLLGLI
jgi:hypothetical protein